MLISSQQFEILKSKDMVNYKNKFSERECNEGKITTYSQGKTQPYIDAMAGIIFQLIIEDQNDPSINRIHAITINCCIVHNAAKPDFLLGTVFITEKGLIPLARPGRQGTRCLTLTQSAKIASDVPHQSAMLFLRTRQEQERLWTHREFVERHNREWSSIQINVDPVSSAIKRQRPDSPSDESSFEVLYGPLSPEMQLDDISLSSSDEIESKELSITSSDDLDIDDIDSEELSITSSDNLELSITSSDDLNSEEIDSEEISSISSDDLNEQDEQGEIDSIDSEEISLSTPDELDIFDRDLLSTEGSAEE
jgi:hypothetical protein